MVAVEVLAVAVLAVAMAPIVFRGAALADARMDGRTDPNGRRSSGGQFCPEEDLRRHLIKYDLKSFQSHFDVTAATLPRGCSGAAGPVSKARPQVFPGLCSHEGLISQRMLSDTHFPTPPPPARTPPEVLLALPLALPFLLFFFFPIHAYAVLAEWRLT